MCGNPLKAVASIFESTVGALVSPFTPGAPRVPDAPEPPARLPEDAFSEENANAPMTAEEMAFRRSRERPRGRSSLRIDLSTGVGVSGGTGLNIPRG